MSLSPGDRLGPYEVLSAVGAGGMGEVYRARDSRLGRDVAIKVLPTHCATDSDRVRRFEQEARSASALNHPNILTIHDVGQHDGTMYFAMEWVEGRTLRDAMTGGRWPVRRTLEIAHQIAEGLAKAHAAGIVHRDLKPENVMLSSDGFAKIIDFGLAKLAASSTPAGGEMPTAASGTMTGVLVGTVSYMSPEQASGGPADYRSDQFALGLLIYELATGKRPFARATVAQSLAAVIEEEPEPIERLNPQVPSHLVSVVARCLEKDPSDRYESTRDLARDLKQILESQSGRTTQPERPRPRWGPRHRAAAAAVIATIAAALGTWWWRAAREAPASAGTPLLAVRPLRNLSPDPAQAYFAAGLTEEIRGRLSQMSALRLLSQNAVAAYRDSDLSKMARELGVGSLVEGSVRVDGTRVRIAAELIDARTQQTLWSEQYDRDLADVFAVQSDVALRIARALHANLSPGEQQRLQGRPTQNLDAYRLYLQAQEKEMSERRANLEGIDLLHQALGLDPDFALARARLAYRQRFMAYYDDTSWIDKGLAEAQAALHSNPTLPQVHAALASLYGAKGLDAEARLSFLRALELDPNAPSHNLSIHEANFGRFEEALYWARRAFLLSGKQANDFYHLAVPLVALRDDDLSRYWLAEAERRFPTFARVQIMRAVLDTLQGSAGGAEARLATALARDPGNEEVKTVLAEAAYLADSDRLDEALTPFMRAPPATGFFVALSVRLRYAYLLTKRGDAARVAPLVAEAERLAHARIEAGDAVPDLRVELAGVAVLRRQHDAAIEWLSRAHDGGYRQYGVLALDPMFAPLRFDARFRDALERMRKDVEAQRVRARDRGLLDVQQLLAPRASASRSE